MGDFSTRVYEVVKRIPTGKVATYGQIARMIGSPKAARFVGYALHANPTPGTTSNCIPCHRVVFKNGSVTRGFAFGGAAAQRALLEAEGISFIDEDRVNLDLHGWNGDESDLP